MSDLFRRIERIAHQSAVQRLRGGDLAEVLADYEDLDVALSSLEERAASGDGWALSKIELVRARLRGFAAALDLFSEV